MFTNETLDLIDSIVRGEDITKEIYFVQGSKNYKFLKQYEFNVFQIHDILEVGMFNDINIFCIIHGNTKKNR